MFGFNTFIGLMCSCIAPYRFMNPMSFMLLSSLTDWLLDAKQSLDVMRYIGVLDFKTRPDAYNHDIHGNGCVTEFIPTPVGKTLSSTCSRTDYIIHARCVSPEFATDN